MLIMQSVDYAKLSDLTGPGVALILNVSDAEFSSLSRLFNVARSMDGSVIVKPKLH